MLQISAYVMFRKILEVSVECPYKWDNKNNTSVANVIKLFMAVSYDFS